MTWLGTSIYLQFTTTRLAKANDPERMAAFAKDGILSGFAGCNNYNATYVTSGTNSITVSNVATTRMACQGDAMTLEGEYLAALAKVTTYQITAGALTLRDGGGAAQATYTTA